MRSFFKVLSRQLSGVTEKNKTADFKDEILTERIWVQMRRNAAELAHPILGMNDNTFQTCLSNEADKIWAEQNKR